MKSDHHESWSRLALWSCLTLLCDQAILPMPRVKKRALEITGSNPIFDREIEDVRREQEPLFFQIVFMSGVARAPKPCSHALSLGLAIIQTLSRFSSDLPVSLAPGRLCLALTRASVTTRLAALLQTQPAAVSLEKRFIPATPNPSLEQPDKAFDLSCYSEPGNEISLMNTEYRDGNPPLVPPDPSMF